MTLKIGGLYQFVGGNWPVYLQKNCDTTGLRQYDTNGLRRNDLFVVVTSDELYTEILVSKDGKRGFIAKLQKRCGLGWFEEVKVEEQ
ncbi:MAG: hypothetical protein E6R04_07620 [Spirochaetes bacterium]|nr:MAG: hypothetical protein E6R04_07620 [Spirochaetota bacterium]